MPKSKSLIYIWYICITTVLLLGIFTFSFAAFNEQINYQGKLTNTSGVKVSDGNKCMRFSLYTVSENGTPIWTEEWKESTSYVVTTSGLFSVLLGTHSSLSNINFNQILYLQVDYDPGCDGTYEEVFSPRKMLGAVPAAFEAKKLGGYTWESPATIGSDTPNSANFTDLTASGSVGIGTATPAYPLDILSTATAQLALTYDLSNYTTFQTDSLGNLTITPTGGSVYFSKLIGGTGTTSDLYLQTTSGVGTTGADMHFLVGNNGATEAMTILNSGYVGVGTTSPGDKLDVVGNIRNIQNSAFPPTRVGAVTLSESYGRSISVSGRYAYVVTSTSPANVVVVDISNPSSPTRVGAVTLSESNGLSISVSGRYAYVVTNTDPANVVVVDISNPSSPTRVGAVTLSSGESYGRSISVSGRYAYILTYTSPAKVVVVDISGIETTSLMAHSLEAGTLQIRQEATIYNRLSVGGGLNVGVSGIQSAGPLSIIGGSTGSSLSSLDVRNSAGTSLLYVRDDGNVGIGTESPGAKLHILGTSEQLRLGYDASNAVKFAVGSSNNLTITPLVNSTSAFNFTNASSTSIFNIDATNSRVGIGDTTPDAILEVVSSGSSPLFMLSKTAEGDGDAFIVDSSGNVGIGTASPQKKLDVLNADSSAQLRLSQSDSVYSEFYIDAIGDLRISSTAGNIRALNENLWVCSGGACSATDPASKGNVVLENALIFDNDFSIEKTAEGITVYASPSDAAILIFDDGQ